MEVYLTLNNLLMHGFALLLALQMLYMLLKLVPVLCVPAVSHISTHDEPTMGHEPLVDR